MRDERPDYVIAVRSRLYRTSGGGRSIVYNPHIECISPVPLLRMIGSRKHKESLSGEQIANKIFAFDLQASRSKVVASSRDLLLRACHSANHGNSDHYPLVVDSSSSSARDGPWTCDQLSMLLPPRLSTLSNRSS